MVPRLDKDTVLMIDAMRGVAALLVMFTHAFDLAVADAYGWNYASSPEIWRWARASLGHGGFLVWCFFMISGFCIHHSMIREAGEGCFSLPRYALARVTRIYPLFLLGLLLALVAWLLHEDFGEGTNDHPWRKLTATLFSLQILTTPFPAYETSWSLSCEMVYYAVWPAALLTAGWRVNRAALLTLAGGLLTASLIMLAWKGFHKLEHSAFVEGVWILVVLLPVWVCGAWLAEQKKLGRLSITRRLWLASILMCLGAETLLVLMKYYQAPHWAVHLAGLSSIPGLMLFLAGAPHAKLSRYPRLHPVCRWLGQLSYPCYILHMQLLLLLDHFVDQWAGAGAHRLPFWHAMVEFAILFSLFAILGPLLERRCMRWRAGLLSVRQTDAAFSSGQTGHYPQMK